MLHYILASFSPLPLSMLILIAVKGWKGFTLYVSVVPLPVIFTLVGKLSINFYWECYFVGLLGSGLTK